MLVAISAATHFRELSMAAVADFLRLTGTGALVLRDWLRLSFEVLAMLAWVWVFGTSGDWRVEEAAEAWSEELWFWFGVGAGACGFWFWSSLEEREVKLEVLCPESFSEGSTELRPESLSVLGQVDLGTL